MTVGVVGLGLIGPMFGNGHAHDILIHTVQSDKGRQHQQQAVQPLQIPLAVGGRAGYIPETAVVDPQIILPVL